MSRKRSIQMTFRKLEQVIDKIHDEKIKHELLIIHSELVYHYQQSSMEQVKQAIDFFLSHTEEEPFYQQLKELDKEKIAEKLGKSRSYVYNAIRKKTLKEAEKETIRIYYTELL